jgi:SAM-dependent methyltransferase
MNRFLNIGCGHRHHPAWVNLDMRASAPGVIEHDLRAPLPFPDGTFDLVYHSHTLEHLDRAEGERLLRECFRVLAPGGVVRIVVPDLEQIARAYLAALEEVAQSASPLAAANHEWMTIELIDQLVRQQPGGELVRYIARPDLLNADFVAARWGTEGRGLLEDQAAVRRDPGRRPSAWSRFIARASQFRKYPLYARELALRVLLGSGYRTWELGRYRLSGDAHLWMYDRVSLQQTLERCGFTDITRRGAADSSVAGFAAFHLDTEPDGSVYRPASLFMEGRRPDSANQGSPA